MEDIFKAGLVGGRSDCSLLPFLHRMFGRYEYRLYGLSAGEFPDFLRHGDFDALNVADPFRRTAATLCDTLSPLAERIGAVNTVIRTADGALHGENTDYAGFKKMVSVLGVPMKGRRCAVFGRGGAAAAVKAVLEDLGAREVLLLARGEQPPRMIEVIVNATPVGSAPDTDKALCDPADHPACAAVFDLVCNPEETKLMRLAFLAGVPRLGGLVMLAAQAKAAAALFLKPAKLPHNIYLYGPPGCGKTHYARALAPALGMKYVDLDLEIEKAAGKSVADIFAENGEAEFRIIEKNVLRRIACDSTQIVALGGGALLDAGSLKLARMTGRIAVPDWDELTLIRRLAADPIRRPLLAHDLVGRLSELLCVRAEHYQAVVQEG